jgi:hypothetical protein
MLNKKVEIKFHTLYGFQCRGLFAKDLIKVGGLVRHRAPTSLSLATLAERIDWA